MIGNIASNFVNQSVNIFNKGWAGFVIDDHTLATSWTLATAHPTNLPFLFTLRVQELNFKMKHCLQITLCATVSQFWLRFGLAGSGCSCCWVAAVAVRSSPLGENVSQYKFSFLCTRRTWERRLSRRADRYAQWGHKCGFSPVCIRLCWINCTNEHSEVKKQPLLHAVYTSWFICQIKWFYSNKWDIT